MGFLNDDFMLKGSSAKNLYSIAQRQPIFDFHCHLEARDIYEDIPFLNIVDLWLSEDHYKWRLMRANGIPEKYITGDASREEKFKAWAMTLSRAIGNPLYHWSHLEMKEVFKVDDFLNEDNWEKIYHKMNEFILVNKLSPRKLIKMANVKFIGTTDHPLDDLLWHKKIEDDKTMDVIVAPTFRADDAFVNSEEFPSFIKRLGDKVNKKMDGFDDVVEALDERIDYFVEFGARATDVSLEKIIYLEANKRELDIIFKKAMNFIPLNEEEVYKWQTEMFISLNNIYKRKNLVSQVHFGALRNNNSSYYQSLGKDVGFDSMGDQIYLAKNLNKYFDRLIREKSLPRMIWYNLNPIYNSVLSNTIANFQANEDNIRGIIQFGAAWWFNDTKNGILSQLDHYSEQGMLANFVGMLTDSRSFLSYQRHDYFRRILCSYIGEWVDFGEIPESEELITPIIEGICYENAVSFFGMKNDIQ